MAGANVNKVASPSATRDPFTNPGAWDVALIAGVPTPGIIPQGGIDFDREHKWDVKTGKGIDGATETYTGKPPAEGKLTLQFWTPEHFVAWDAFSALLLTYDATKQAPTPATIYHPSLVPLRISAVVVKKIGNVKHVGHKLYEVKVELLEYLIPPSGSSVSTPTGAANDDAENEANKPLTPFQKAVLDRTNKIGSLFKDLSSRSKP